MRTAPVPVRPRFPGKPTLRVRYCDGGPQITCETTRRARRPPAPAAPGLRVSIIKFLREGRAETWTSCGNARTQTGALSKIIWPSAADAPAAASFRKEWSSMTCRTSGLATAQVGQRLTREVSSTGTSTRRYQSEMTMDANDAVISSVIHAESSLAFVISSGVSHSAGMRSMPPRLGYLLSSPILQSGVGFLDFEWIKATLTNDADPDRRDRTLLRGGSRVGVVKQVRGLVQLEIAQMGDRRVVDPFLEIISERNLGYVFPPCHPGEADHACEIGSSG